jgi:mannose-6-phosphate isomerase-like protein (cupin superfamily)
MNKRATATSRRRFIERLTVGSLAGTAVLSGVARAAQTAPLPGVVVHGQEGLKIPPTPDGRVVTIKVDPAQTPGVRMSMIAEDLPPKSEIRVHLHQHEDEIIFIRMGTGVATLGDREIPVAAGATVYVPQGQWHGLRNNSQDVLGMTAIYSPPGFEQIFKDRLLHPNRTPAEAESVRAKFGIVYRDRQ